MSNVIKFNKKEEAKDDDLPWYAGECYCFDCKHVWADTVNSMTDFIKCPECGMMRGRIRYPLERNPVFHCNCQNTFFQIMPGGHCYCPMCGTFAYVNDSPLVAVGQEDNTVTISRKEFNLLFLKSAMIESLKYHGVHLWEKYELAMEDFNKKDGE